ncbi:nuclear transport factor 2 family protein [Pseudocolwellia sp. HL-MZ7]|uniref:nuclear transport factor 2 family protein n=1 Tax=Pseudocolwellia sp. HL-MZ7 TaxID=3400627 RepID=UPI003CF59E55
MKFLYLFISVALLFSHSAAANTPSTLNKIVQSGNSICEETIRAYPKLRDNGPIKEYGTLFSENSLFEVKKLGISLKGREQITDRLSIALATTKTHHIVNDVHLNLFSDDTYHAKSFFALTLLKITEPKSATMNITGHYQDVLHFDGKHCEIVSRQVNLDPQTP